MKADATLRRVWHVEQNRLLLEQVRWCSSFLCKLKGFTGKRTLGRDEGLVLVERKDSRVNSAIHMLFVQCELGIIWINQAGFVVDTIIARPWHLQYTPGQPACYVLECHPELVSAVAIGDQLQFQPFTTTL